MRQQFERAAPRVALAAIVLGAGCGFAAPDVARSETVMITGANSGIGLEFARQYAEMGWTVIATHRRSSPPETLAAIAAEHDNLRIERLDVTSREEAEALDERLGGMPIDVLINNAGVYNDRSACQDEGCPGDWSTQVFGNLDYELLDLIFDVNVKGPLLVSEVFIDNVRSSGQKKLISISSTNGSLTQPLGGAGLISYRASKAALNRAMMLVALNERRNGVIVALLHPGTVVTERQSQLEGTAGTTPTDESVAGMIKVIEGLAPGDSGRFLQFDGATAPW